MGNCCIYILINSIDLIKFNIALILIKYNEIIIKLFQC